MELSRFQRYFERGEELERAGLYRQAAFAYLKGLLLKRARDVMVTLDATIKGRPLTAEEKKNAVLELLKEKVMKTKSNPEFLLALNLS